MNSFRIFYDIHSITYKYYRQNKQNIIFPYILIFCFRIYSAPKVRVIKSRIRPFRLEIGLIIGLVLLHNVYRVIIFIGLLGIIIVLRFRLKSCIGGVHFVDKLLEENAATCLLIINGVVICKFPAMPHYTANGYLGQQNFAIILYQADILSRNIQNCI